MNFNIVVSLINFSEYKYQVYSVLELACLCTQLSILVNDMLTVNILGPFQSHKIISRNSKPLILIFIYINTASHSSLCTSRQPK